jgi:hypothetical protein
MDPIPQVLSYRLLINLAQLANLALFWWLLRRLTHTARLATFAAFAWSPLLLFTVAANGHNDAVMITLMLLACAVLARGLLSNSGLAGRLTNRAWLGALTFLVLATLVKWASGAAAMFFAVAWARCLTGWRERLVWLGSAGVLLAGLVVLIAWPWLPGLLAPGARVNDVGLSYSNWLIDVPAAWFASHVLDRDGLAIPQARAAARAVFLVPALGVVAWLVVAELRRVWRVARADAPVETVRVVVGASARTLLAALVLVSPQLQAWYFSWPLALGLLLGWRDTTARVALAYSLLFPPVAYVREQTGGSPVDPLLVAYAVLPLALPAVMWLRRKPDPMAAVLGQARGVLGLGRWRA